MKYRLEADGGVVVAIENGRIVEPDGRCDLSLELGAAEIRPGLINAHDHLHRNHYPRLGDPPYADAYAWGRDLHERFAHEIERAKRLPRRDALLFGALKNLLGGATTVVHHDPWERDFERDFPVRVPRLRTLHSLGTEPDPATAAKGDPRTLDRPLCLHLAEGVNRTAASEVREAHQLGLLNDSLLAVHGVGVDDEGALALARANAAVVWCPTSNVYLFGRTAPRALLESDVDVLLGTDALLTGAGTLLDELRAAKHFGSVDETRLEDAIGITAARRLGLFQAARSDASLGASEVGHLDSKGRPPRLTPGMPADIVALRRPVLDATSADVALVVVAGEPRLADERFGELFEAAAVAAERLRVGGTSMLVAAPLASIAERVVELTPACGRIFKAKEPSRPRSSTAAPHDT